MLNAVGFSVRLKQVKVYIKYSIYYIRIEISSYYPPAPPPLGGVSYILSENLIKMFLNSMPKKPV